MACSGPPPIDVCEARDGLVPVCGFQNPEDLVALPDGWLLLSEMDRSGTGGKITAYRTSDGTRRDLHSAGADFLPHGIDLSRDGSTLYVVDHGAGETIEVFALTHASATGPSLEHVRSIPVPEELDANLNDLAATGDGFVTTKMFPTNALKGMFGMLVGSDTGQLFTWSESEGWKGVAESEGVGPNGVAASADGRHYYLAEWGENRVVRVNAEGGGRLESGDLGFSPDNLSWTPAGQLLVAGQVASPTEALSCADIPENTSCALGTGVSRLNPETLESEAVLLHDPATVIGAASVAIEQDGRIWIGSFSGDRIASMEAQ
jgi:DNA-binding beta-propeller fold protein YncE